MVLYWRKALISRLETNFIKLNILDVIGFVNECARVGSSDLISVDIMLSLMDHEKYSGTLMSSTFIHD